MLNRIIAFLERLLGLDKPKQSLPIPEIPKDNIEEIMTSSFQNPLSPEVWFLICQVSKNMDIDHALVAGVVMTESAGNTWAARFEPGWKYFWKTPEFAKSVGASVATEQNMQATSWGLMQVMGTVARELGHKGWVTDMCDPKIGLEYGIRHLKAKMKQFGEEGGIAAYNAGTPRKNTDGSFVNQAYVDKVQSFRRGFLDVTRPPIA